jgi:hypothetical protein
MVRALPAKDIAAWGFPAAAFNKESVDEEDLR